MKQRWLLFFSFFPITVWGSSADIRFTAQVQPNPATPNQYLRFILTANASLDDISFSQKNPPAIPLQRVGKSSRMSYENGRSTHTTSWIFLFKTSQVGYITFPSFSVLYRGESYTVPATHFTVQPDPATSATPKSSPQQAISSSPNERISKAQLLLSGSFPKRWYVGQCCPANVQLLVNARVRGQLNSYPHKQGDKFSASKMMEDPKKESTVRNGESYGLLSWPTLLTALQSGNTSLSFSVDMEIEQASRSNALFEEDDEDPLSILKKGLGVIQMEPQTLKTKPYYVEVLPLPLPQPKEFTQAIGQFQLLPLKTFETEFIQHEPISLTVDVTGSGNFEAIQAPSLQYDPQYWRAYDPKKHFESTDSLGFKGTMHFTYTLVPLKEGNVPLPSVTFCFFNPVNGQYETLTSESKALSVKPAIRQPSSIPTTSAVSPSSPSAEEIPAKDSSSESSIGEHTITMEPITWVSSTSLFWWIQGFLSIVVIIGGWRYRKTHTNNYRMQQASKQQLQRLQRTLQEAFRQKDGVGVYTAAHEYLEWKLQKRGSSITAILQDSRFSEEQRKRLQNFEQTYQASRFGQMSIECPPSLKEMQQFLDSFS